MTEESTLALARSRRALDIKSLLPPTLFGIAISAIFLICVVLTAWTEGVRLWYHFDAAAAILSFLLVGGPLSSYYFYVEVRRSRRPALAGLMHGIAIFFALISLGIADLIDPVTRALGKNVETSAAPLPPAPPPATASTPIVPAATPPQAPPSANTGNTSISVQPAKAPGAQPGPASAATSPRTHLETSYSLYDMLSLLGMVATVSLIVLGALVPEETRVIERRRETRHRVLCAFADYAKALTSFYETLGRGQPNESLALEVSRAGAELGLLIDREDAFDLASARIAALHTSFGVDARLSRISHTVAIPTPSALVAELRTLRHGLEEAYPRER